MEACSLDIGPLSDIANGILGINGFWGVFSQLLGYVIIKVQVEGGFVYNEDQVALVVPDSTIFGPWVPVTLGTPTINWFINMIKESKINELSASLDGLGMTWLLACQQADISLKEQAAMHQTVDQTSLKEAVKMTNREEVDTFSSKIIHGQMKTMLLGNNRNVNESSSEGGDGPHLAHGLSVVNQSDFQDQMSCSSSEKPDGHPNHFYQEN